MPWGYESSPSGDPTRPIGRWLARETKLPLLKRYRQMPMRHRYGHDSNSGYWDDAQAESDLAERIAVMGSGAIELYAETVARQQRLFGGVSYLAWGRCTWCGVVPSSSGVP